MNTLGIVAVAVLAFASSATATVIKNKLQKKGVIE